MLLITSSVKPCTCTLRGLFDLLPTSGKLGWPEKDRSADYIEVCNLACMFGYCPKGICTPELPGGIFTNIDEDSAAAESWRPEDCSDPPSVISTKFGPGGQVNTYRLGWMCCTFSGDFRFQVS
jgi:hypothetical protein